MALPISFAIVEGGFTLSIIGLFEIAMSWLSCFATYAGVHIGSKVISRYKNRKTR